MASQILKSLEFREQAEPAGAGRLDIGIALVPLPHEDARCSYPPADPLVPWQFVLGERATTLAGPEEVLIADPRGDLTPAQMVERKLLALLAGNPGAFIQATGSSEDTRRILGEGRTAPCR